MAIAWTAVTMADVMATPANAPRRRSPRILGLLVSGVARLHRSGRGFVRSAKNHLPGWCVVNAGARPSRARNFVPNAAPRCSADLVVHCAALSDKQAFWSRS